MKNPIHDTRRFAPGLIAVAAACLVLSCGSSSEGGDSRSDGPPGRRGGGGRPGGARPVAAVPVETTSVTRRDISSYIETNGVLEAENEVDIAARGTGPVEEILTEEGQQVDRGELLARLEQDAIRAQREVSRIALQEAQMALDRAERLRANDLISQQDYDAAIAAHESARAQFEGDDIQLRYTEIRAPFAGVIVERYVDPGQTVSMNQALFRLSDFTPLLCPIQVPERELGKLREGQRAYLTVEPFPGERFDARVLRISPVVDSETGTIRVTLDVQARQKLRPGMFARVFLEIDVRTDALVVPRSSLSLESVGDVIYVAEDGTAKRREVELGYREGDVVEVVSGLDEGDAIVVVGQDGLSEGTPIRVLNAVAESEGTTGEPPVEARIQRRSERADSTDD